MDVVHKIENVEVITRDSSSSEASNGLDKPVEPPVIKSITVETFGVDYGIPETQDAFDIQKYFGGTTLQ